MTKLWIILHHHRHGVDAFPAYGEDEPDDNEMIALVNVHSEFDDDSEEWVEARGPYDLRIPISQAA